MKLYHYAPKGNTVLTNGILSLAKNPKADLAYYTKRSGATTHAGIVCWLEKSFKGRSYGIRLLIEPLKATQATPSLKAFILGADLFEVDVSALAKDGLIQAIYVSPSVLEKAPANIHDEGLYPLSDITQIDLTPNDYSVLNDAKGRRFAFLRYYLFIMKDGLIPSKYVKKV